MLRSRHPAILRRTTTKGILIRLLELPDCHRSPRVPPIPVGSRCLHTPVLFARNKTATPPTEAPPEVESTKEASDVSQTGSEATHDADQKPAESADPANATLLQTEVKSKKQKKKKRSRKAVRREKAQAKALAKRKERKEAKSKTKAKPKRPTKAPAKQQHAAFRPDESRRRVGIVLWNFRSKTRDRPPLPSGKSAPSDQLPLPQEPPRDSNGLLARLSSLVTGVAGFIKGRPPCGSSKDDNEKVVGPIAALQDQATRTVPPPPPKRHSAVSTQPASKTSSSTGDSQSPLGGADSSTSNQTKAEPGAVTTRPDPSPVLPPLPIAKIKLLWKCYPDTMDARRKRLEQAKNWSQWVENSLTLAPEKLPPLPVLTDKASEKLLFNSESPLRIQMLAWEGDIIVAYAAGRAAVRRNIPLGLRGTAKSLLVGNISLSYLGLAYDLKRPPFHDPDNGPAQKAFADHFEAYIGAFHRQALADRRLDDFTGFMDKLFSEGVFPAVAADTEAYLKKGKKGRPKLSPQSGPVTGVPVPAKKVEPSSVSPAPSALEAPLPENKIDTRTDEHENVVIARTDRLGPLFASTGWKKE